MTECETCEGTGCIERLSCTNWSNECCGGCYDEIMCEECNGTGYEEEE
jgi:hypothetical protein